MWIYLCNKILCILLPCPLENWLGTKISLICCHPNAGPQLSITAMCNMFMLCQRRHVSIAALYGPCLHSSQVRKHAAKIVSVYLFWLIWYYWTDTDEVIFLAHIMKWSWNITDEKPHSRIFCSLPVTNVPT